MRASTDRVPRIIFGLSGVCFVISLFSGSPVPAMIGVVLCGISVASLALVRPED